MSNRESGFEHNQNFVAWVESSVKNQNFVFSIGKKNIPLVVAREALANGVSKKAINLALKIVSEEFRPEGNVNELFEHVKHDYQNEKPAVLFLHHEKEKLSARTLAIGYLQCRGLFRNGIYLLRNHRQEFFVYTENRYVKTSDHELRSDIMLFLQSLNREKRHLVNEIVSIIEAQTLVKDHTPLPTFLTEPLEGDASGYLSLKNGIFSRALFDNQTENVLLPHTPSFFTTVSLPFEYGANAKCPIWDKFLDTALPDDEVRNFLAQWFGYCLFHDVRQQKFLVLHGAGSNGKSVVCVVLRAVLGNENVSAVGLEQLSPVRTFPLAAMVGKLANIVEEIGEFDKTAEGILKDLASGGRLTIERKHKDPFEAQLTARLVFATNSIPRFRDRSNGLWRRLVIVPFKRKFSEEEQDKRLTDPSWWQSSGELAGIFNWALNGLAELTRLGKFSEPKECAALREEHKVDSNPAAIFLLENCVESNLNESIGSSKLYVHYSGWAKRHGYQALGEVLFSKEVRSYFPSCSKSENALHLPDGTRSRVWRGIKWRNGTPPAFLVETLESRDTRR